MNNRLLAIIALSLPLSVVTGVALWEHGYLAIFESALISSASAQVFVDLCTSLVLVVAWLIPDARERDIPAWPFLLITPFLGSFAPLAYLFVRELTATRGAATGVARA